MKRKGHDLDAGLLQLQARKKQLGLCRHDLVSVNHRVIDPGAAAFQASEPQSMSHHLLSARALAFERDAQGLRQIQRPLGHPWTVSLALSFVATPSADFSCLSTACCQNVRASAARAGSATAKCDTA